MPSLKSPSTAAAAPKNSSSESISLIGVRTNNLKNIDVSLPLGGLTVVTGVSGSGKSSLVFDTLYSESYRRYVESLSSFARQYLKALPKPLIERVKNLPAAIAVRQSRSGATSRSTVGTITELNDILRVLFTHLSEIYCLECQRLVERESGDTIGQKTISDGDLRGKKCLILAPLSKWGKVKTKELREQLAIQGFSRVFSAGKVHRLDEFKFSNVQGVDVVVDRIEVKDENLRRLREAAALALRVGRGQMRIQPEDENKGRVFSSELECCGRVYKEPSNALFSFNHPIGACQRCQGFGFAAELDWAKIIPDQESSLAERGVAPWNFGKHDECYDWAQKSAKAAKISLQKKSFSEYTASEWAWLKSGKDSPTDFNGIEGYFAWLDSKRYKPHYRIHAARYRKYVVCPVCDGARLIPEALACCIMGDNIAKVSHMSVEAFGEWIDRLQKVARGKTAEGEPAKLIEKKLARAAGNYSEGIGVSEAIEEAAARVGYLVKIGVAYLSLDRASRTLSGGEMQRISMARCLGSALTETMFCLDEPTAGLHARDSRNLLEIMCEMRDQGNSVVVVEHEQTIIDGADYLVEIGPKAGHEGGQVTFSGVPKGNRGKVVVGVNDKPWPHKDFIEVVGARTHNLKTVSARFPVGALTAVCGVSGSGKTSLIQHTLFPLLASALGQDDASRHTEPVAKGVKPLPLIKKHASVLLMSQGALGRSTRSNIATYLGIMDEIRKLLAATPEAQDMGLTPGSFSFNTPGGRCETCRGLGTVVEDLSFLGEMEVTCPTCQGRRFTEEVLSVKYRNLSLIQMLEMTAAQAREFFFERSSVVKTLDVVNEMGLGYVTLGQHTSSFSGGEAQRLKLVNVLREARSGQPSILIFDEPTTGLSDSDVQNLLKQMRVLTKRGHTVIVVEHHLNFLRQADWLIEIGPDAAEKGGELVFEGIPADLAAEKRSVTARFF